MIYKFPKNFLFGVGISSYQTEGNNLNSDWWFAENSKFKNKFTDRSGISNDFWNRYEEDINLVAELGCEVFRLSIEWSRIEPREGFFDDEAIFHYKKIMEYARSKKLKIFLTLHHFTIPLWFEEKGGFSNLKSPIYFSRYALKCVEEFKQYTQLFTTINEAEVLAVSGYLNGEWPPFKKNKLLFLVSLINMQRCNNLAYKIIKPKYNVSLGISTNQICYQPFQDKFLDKFLSYLIIEFKLFISLFLVRNYLDFIGLNFYQTSKVSGFNFIRGLEPSDDMGWYINFDSIRVLLKKIKRFKKPIYITENGIANQEDDKREWYIKYNLISIWESIHKDNVPVKGYIYWSLIDNYEWQYGFTKKFGLVNVERDKKLKRTKRKSFTYYQLICKTKQIIE